MMIATVFAWDFAAGARKVVGEVRADGGRATWSKDLDLYMKSIQADPSKGEALVRGLPARMEGSAPYLWAEVTEDAQAS